MSKSGLPVTRDRALVAIEDSQTRRHLVEALARIGYATDADGEDPRRPAYAFLVLQDVDTLLRLPRQQRELPVILLSGGPGSRKPAGDIVGLSTPYTLLTLQLAIARALQPLAEAGGDQNDSRR